MLVDLSALPHEIREKMAEILTQRFDADMVEALDRQKAIAAWNHSHEVDRRPGTEFRQTMAVDPFIDMYWRQKLGEEWDQPETKEWFARRNEAVRVKSPGKVLVNGWGQGGRGQRSEVRGQREGSRGQSRGNVRSRVVYDL
jgi:hypothetical protein